jgi:hypothetical protein
MPCISQHIVRSRHRLKAGHIAHTSPTAGRDDRDRFPEGFAVLGAVG